MKTDQERIDYLAGRIREFKVLVSGGGELSGGFGKLPKDGPITLNHIEQSFSEFRLSGNSGVLAQGSLEKGYVLFGDPVLEENIGDPVS